VTRLGAELVSLARRDERGEWTGFLHRDGDVSAPATGWKNHATLMGYYLHRIKNERSIYRGHEIRGGTHSFLRHKYFAAPEFVVSNKSASLTYRIAPGQIEPQEYPFRVALALTYALEEATLRVTFHFENQEPELSTHVSFGLHPGFAASSIEAAEVILPPGSYVRHFAPDNFLSGETREFKHDGGPMPFAKSELPGSFLLELRDVPAPIFVMRDLDSRRETWLNFSGVPYVTLWSDGGAFVCVEPCWGLPDHHEQRSFEKKLGIQEIEPRGTLTRSFTITPELAR
jgi:galactose mutarotase-like enzyme